MVRLSGLIGPLASLALLCAPGLELSAHDQGHGEGAAITPAPAVHSKAEAYFTDLPVVTQDGQELRFYTDVLKDKVVLVSLFYTSCPDACPLITANMAAVQDLLGDDFGRSVHFVSLSVDPETDRPEVLKEYAARFQARPGWLFLTGERANVMTVTHRLGQPDDNVMAHPPFLLVGDTRRGYWRKFLPDVAPEELASFLRGLASGS